MSLQTSNVSIISERRPYRGRFAPSPTGSLHLGSLVTAVSSYLHARQQRGQWLLRIEDVDRVRCNADAAQRILRDLTLLGMHWDGEIRYQTQCDAAYQQALDTLLQHQHAFPCACTRSRLNGRPYDGHCRQGLAAGETARAFRVKVPNQNLCFNDQLQGIVCQNLSHSVGDFVIRRADGLFAYQLAVVVDDAAQGITDIVRGSDLLDNTPRQLHLQRLLQYPEPRYLHLPILVNTDGRKLSKQHHSPAIDTRQPVALLWQTLHLLGQAPPAELQHVSLTRFWEWAISHWQVQRIPAVTHIVVSDEIIHL